LELAVGGNRVALTLVLALDLVLAGDSDDDECVVLAAAASAERGSKLRCGDRLLPRGDDGAQTRLPPPVATINDAGSDTSASVDDANDGDDDGDMWCAAGAASIGSRPGAPPNAVSM
jgi:hypothetical protein